MMRTYTYDMHVCSACDAPHDGPGGRCPACGSFFYEIRTLNLAPIDEPADSIDDQFPLPDAS